MKPTCEQETWQRAAEVRACKLVCGIKTQMMIIAACGNFSGPKEIVV